MPKLPQPIPYQGSKRNIAGAIFTYMPPRIQRLVEPFAGSAALSIYAAGHNLARSFHLNDLNGPLVTLLDMIINDPNHIADLYARLWHQQLGQERSFYDQVRNQFNQTHSPELLLYLLARCVKAAVRYNSNGQFNQGPDNRRRGRHPDSMKEEIESVSKLLRNRTTLSSLPYQELLPLLDPETDIVYMDPPYQGTSTSRDRRYLSSIEMVDFVRFLAELNARNFMYVVSYDGHKGSKKYGVPLPARLGLHHVEIAAGRSSQSTLLGEEEITYESLYFSRTLVERTGRINLLNAPQAEQIAMQL